MAKTGHSRPSKAEHASLKAKLQKHGVAESDIAGAVGADVSGRDRRAIAHQLISWLRGRPKAR